MNYIKHYKALCLSRNSLNRVKSTEKYYEAHHIVPKSLGGTDDDSNLVLLTPKEHYIAHLLLFYHYKQIGGDSLRKMAFALVSMASNNPNHSRESFNSRLYSNLREAAMLSRLGHKVEDTTNYQKPKSESHKESIRQARLQAPPRSKSTRQKLRIAALNRVDIFPNNYTTVECPNCKKEGQTNAMKRWHFENCKFRKEVIDA